MFHLVTFILLNPLCVILLLKRMSECVVAVSQFSLLSSTSRSVLGLSVTGVSPGLGSFSAAYAVR